MFMLICGRVHWTLALMSLYSKTFDFDHPRKCDLSPFLKIYSMEHVFKISVFVAENAVYVCTGGANGEKNLFSKISG